LLDNLGVSTTAMEPHIDKGIVRELKLHDEHLDIEWNQRSERFVVTGRNLKKHVKREHLMTVQNEDGSFRPLDRRTVVGIKLADSFRYNDIEHFKKLIEENRNSVEEKQARELSDAFRERNEDLYRAYFGYNYIAPVKGWKEFN
jgi:hypothetical protein